MVCGSRHPIPRLYSSILSSNSQEKNTVRIKVVGGWFIYLFATDAPHARRRGGLPTHQAIHPLSNTPSYPVGLSLPHLSSAGVKPVGGMS